MDIINIGNRRELFWDDTLINASETGTAFKMHQPVDRGCVIKLDGPLGCDGAEYTTLLKDGDTYRMYIDCRRYHLYPKQESLTGGIRYFESKDGIHWDEPELGICEMNGSSANNILLNTVDPTSPYYAPGYESGGFEGFIVAIDLNPNCPPEEKYKGMTSHAGKLSLFVSEDAIHFKYKKDISVGYGSSFDSLNTLTYDPYVQKYRIYCRGFHPRASHTDNRWIRDIRLLESYDLENWERAKSLNYGDYIDWQMYTNCIFRYYRAPHVYVGFPVRYHERESGCEDNYEELCGLEYRKTRTGRHATALTDAMFMTSHDGINFKRYPDAFMTPGPEHPMNWVYGSSYMAVGMAETPSIHPGCDNEISIYTAHNRFSGRPAEIYRYSLRLDGFVSQFAPWHGTQLVTKPFIYEGKELYINFSTSAYGHMRLTLRTIDGSDSISTGEIFGDSTNRHVRFVGDKTPADLAGKPVIMSIQMRDAHMYSFKFE